MSLEKYNPIVGVKKSENGTLDYSHSAEMTIKKKIIIPDGWNVLTHGSNLSMVQWGGDNIKQLDDDILIIKGTGLSTIGNREREDSERIKEEFKKQGVKYGNFDTTDTFSSGKGEPLVLNIIFPSFGSRDKRFDEIKEKWIRKYGNDMANSITTLVDKVYWNNPNGGQHPILPTGLKLKKIEDKKTEGKREITYIPEILANIYNNELNT